MVDITPTIPKSRQLITGYGNGGFKINQQFTQGSLLVFPNETLSWNVSFERDLTPADFEQVLQRSAEIEILLIGTGKTMRPISPEIKSMLKAKKIAVDVMDSGAACRTYNVLMSEERKVAAAVIAV